MIQIFCDKKNIFLFKKLKNKQIIVYVQSNHRRFARKSDLKKTVDHRPGGFPSESGDVAVPFAQALDLTQTPTPHRTSSSNWLDGRSRSNSVSSQRFLSPSTSSHPNLFPAAVEHHGTVMLYLCPDWQSLDPADWIFWGPRAAATRRPSEQPASSTSSPSKMVDLSRSSSLDSFSNLLGPFTPKMGGPSPRKGLSGSVVGSPGSFSFRVLTPRRSPAVRSSFGVSSDLKPTAI